MLQLCKLQETEHMLFTYIQIKSYGKQLPRNTYQILKVLTASQYSSIYLHLDFSSIISYIIVTSLQAMIFFATVIRFVWKAHWQQFFEQTPVLDEIVINQIQKELLKLSAYNSLLISFVFL